jgi:quercetin dioxygenase-like cupin family protein
LQTLLLKTRLTNSKNEPTFNILGPEVQFLVDPAEAAEAFGLIRGVVAPGIAIPLHSHADPEVMFVLDGALEFLQHNGKAGRWLTARRGEIISIPGNVKHALRNSSHENTSLLLVTTPNIYGFFRAIADPVNPGAIDGSLHKTQLLAGFTRGKRRHRPRERLKRHREDFAHIGRSIY